MVPENGVHMLMWVGSQANPEWVRAVFGVTSSQQIDTQVCELPDLDNPISSAVRSLVEDARRKRRVAMRVRRLTTRCPSFLFFICTVFYQSVHV